MRIDKFLCDMGLGTRTEIKKDIKNKTVFVNDKIVTNSDLKIHENIDRVVYKGEIINYEKYVYFMLNKPSGYISATEGNVPTVLDLVPNKYKGLFPVGRLDKDTEGLLLITNDGQLAHNLLSPKKHVDKEYYVLCKCKITDEMVSILSFGITLKDGTKFLGASIKKIDDKSCFITIHEGKFHEIKRMFEYVNNEVIYLKRIRMKELYLDENLKLGDYRKLTKEELASLKKDEN